MGKLDEVQIGLWIRKLQVRVLPRQPSDQHFSARTLKLRPQAPTFLLISR